jgi:Leucine-rich repeat (LRR) protein
MIEEIEGLQNCNFLIKIDLHNNYLRQIKGLEGKTQLTYLDVSCNRIDDIRSLDHIKS